MTFDINDVVKLKADLPNERLSKGMIGVVVAVFTSPELAYEVEFCNEQGETLTEIALKPELIEPSN
ncbi:DUF4926 domain-containing protein [Saccharospirillum salsuginis]|uniref:DUF4926 domain-containing protein n=1 Tax=Saccharospirillum salsuginis TaxID=418750 RepID=A0A918NG40_9GAMM|nr:DUF4926 domain-containing protein [Saccharospirillum salsuginis]GGX64956.1 hypothetical protein GCM10007392_36020 [Saccharospirillum salsuginis]